MLSYHAVVHVSIAENVFTGKASFLNLSCLEDSCGHFCAGFLRIACHEFFRVNRMEPKLYVNPVHYRPG